MLIDLTRPLLSKLVGHSYCARWVYSMDSADDHAVFAQPLEFAGDFEVSVFVKNATSTGAGQDFVGSEVRCKLSCNGIGQPAFLIGNGTGWVVNLLDTTTDIFNGLAHEIKGTKIGNVYSLFVNGVLKAAATNASLVSPAISTVAKRSNANLAWARATIYNLKINGHLYPINNPNSPEQRSIPDNGNPLTLVNAKPERWSKIKIPCPKPTQPIVSGVFTSDGLQVFTSDNLNIEVQQ